MKNFLKKYGMLIPVTIALGMLLYASYDLEKHRTERAKKEAVANAIEITALEYERLDAWCAEYTSVKDLTKQAMVDGKITYGEYAGIRTIAIGEWDKKQQKIDRTKIKSRLLEAVK